MPLHIIAGQLGHASTATADADLTEIAPAERIAALRSAGWSLDPQDAPNSRGLGDASRVLWRWRSAGVSCIPSPRAPATRRAERRHVGHTERAPVRRYPARFLVKAIVQQLQPNGCPSGAPKTIAGMAELGEIRASLEPRVREPTPYQASS